MRSAPVLTTERLLLRPHRLDDFEAIAAMAADPAVMGGIPGHVQSREDAWRRMMAAPGSWALLGHGYWVIERRSDGAVIGQIGLADFKRDMQPCIEGVPELGYILAASAHGQGFASEATTAVLDWADTVLGAAEVVAMVDSANRRSINVLQKAGFELPEPATYRSEATLLFRRSRP